MSPTDYLKQPYHRIIQSDEHGFYGQIIEFPGCICTGDTPAGVAHKLEEVAESWIEASLAQGQHIPDPLGDDFVPNVRKLLGISPKAHVVRR